MIQVGEMAWYLRFDVLKQNFDVARLNFPRNPPKFKIAPKMAATGMKLVKVTPKINMYVDSFVFLVEKLEYVLKNVLRLLKDP